MRREDIQEVLELRFGVEQTRPLVDRIAVVDGEEKLRQSQSASTNCRANEPSRVNAYTTRLTPKLYTNGSSALKRDEWLIALFAKDQSRFSRPMPAQKSA